MSASRLPISTPRWRFFGMRWASTSRRPKTSRRSACARSLCRRAPRLSSCFRRQRPIRRLRSFSRNAVQGSTTSRYGSTTSKRRWPNCGERGVRLIDDEPRPGAEGAQRRLHPSLECAGRARRAETGRSRSPGTGAAKNHSPRGHRHRDGLGRFFLSRRRRDVRRRAEDVLGEESAARRSQSHSHDDAVPAPARRANHADRCRRRRQDDAEAGGDLSLRARRST